MHLTLKLSQKDFKGNSGLKLELKKILVMLSK